MSYSLCMRCMNILDKETEVCPLCGFSLKEHAEMIHGLKPGSLLHERYIVGCILGQGGFGITYIGYDSLLEVRVAIKEYYPRMVASRDNRQSNSLQWNISYSSRVGFEQGKNAFLKEARKMAKIDTIPEIVRIRDIFAENDTAYIIMDYVEGTTLKSYILSHGVMSFSECAAFLEPLMKGLEKVHSMGIIHRDISPDNIMIRPDGSLRLLDLGAAKDLMAVKSEHSQNSMLVTKKGFSPFEQYTENGEIGAWTDVYALCATIYYCVIGKLPPDAIERVTDDKLDFKDEMYNKLSDDEKAVMKKGLAVSAADRIRSVGELLEALSKAENKKTKKKTKDQKETNETEKKDSKTEGNSKKNFRKAFSGTVKDKGPKQKDKAKDKEKNKKKDKKPDEKSKNKIKSGNASAEKDKKSKDIPTKTVSKRKGIIIVLCWVTAALAIAGISVYFTLDHETYVRDELSAVETVLEDGEEKDILEIIPVIEKYDEYKLSAEAEDNGIVEIKSEDGVTYLCAMDIGTAKVSYEYLVTSSSNEYVEYCGEINVTVNMSQAETEEIQKGRESLSALLSEANNVLKTAQNDAGVNHSNFALEEPALVSAINEFSTRIDSIERAADIEGVSEYYTAYVKPASESLSAAYSKAVQIAAEEAAQAAAAREAEAKKAAASKSTSSSSSSKSTSSSSSSKSTSSSSSSSSSSKSSSGSTSGSYSSGSSSYSGSASSGSYSSGGSSSSSGYSQPSSAASGGASSDKYSSGGKYD